LSFLIGVCKRSQWNSNDVLLGETLHCLEPWRSIYKSALMLGDFSLPVRTEKLMPASAQSLSHMGAFIR
jgi:hypothetical protein